jgi:glucose/arabinose dehydrogenase
MRRAVWRRFTTGMRHAAAIAFIVFAPLAQAVSSARVAGGLVNPIDIAHAGDGTGRLFVAEQRGTVRIVVGGQVAPTPFLDIGANVVAGGEQGLLGMAFHPRYRTDGRVFVDYTRKADGATVISSFRVSAANANVADPASEQVLLVIAQPFPNHNGGALRFGPDGLLYIGMGDGGSANDPDGHAQDPRSLLGKILRVDVDHGVPYAIPPGNPYANGSAGRPEIWAVGVRNPWRMGFDRATGDLYIGDVGQDRYEEIDRFPAGQGAGANLGWRVAEGLHCTANVGPLPCTDATLTQPIVEYSHADGCSVTGGTVYRGAVPALAGRYVYADYCSGRVWSAARAPSGVWSVRDVITYAGSISTFGEDEQGELYFADYTRGELRRFEPQNTDRVDAVEFYHAGLDHYFISAEPSDINALDANTRQGWQRTGQSIPAFGGDQDGLERVYRFYIPPSLGDSHFFTADADEAADVRRRFPGFVEEGPLSMYAALPDRTTGVCPAGMRPVYRIWNQRADSNHRYTTDLVLRDLMIERGGVAEGYGPDGVAMCGGA